MIGRLQHHLWVVAALLCLTTGAHAQTRSLTVDDIVSTEAFGRASIAPNDAWAVYEKRGPYDTAPRFDLGPRSQWAITDLWLLDLRRAGAAPERLLPGEKSGLLRGPWSPSGDRLLVQRLRGDRLEFGVVDVADRTVRWTGLVPEMPAAGAQAEWVSDDRLVLMTRPDGSLPWLLAYYGGSQAETGAAWRRTAEGRHPARTVVETRAGVAAPETAGAEQALILIDLAGGVRRTLARGQIRDFALSPDGTRVAVLSGEGLTPVRPDVIVQMAVPDRQRLRILNLQGEGETVPSIELDVAPHLLRWSPDSEALLVWARQDGQRWEEGGLMRIGRDGAAVEISGGDLAVRPAGTEIDTLRGVQADWMGQAPVLYGRPASGERFDWYALEPGGPARNLTGDLSGAPSRLAGVSGGALYYFADSAFWASDATGRRRLTPAGQPVSEITIGDIEKPFRLRINDAPRRDWATALGADGEILVVNGAGEHRQLGPGRVSPEARVLAASASAAIALDHTEMVETLSVVRPDGARPLDQVNAGLADVALAGTEPLDHDDAFGRPTRSWLFLPRGVSPSAVRGIVVEVYPGSVDTGAWAGPLALTYGLRPSVLAGGGYAVISPSMPNDRDGSNTVDFYVRSVDAAVDAALAAHPDLPRDRIAIAGHSFGGTVALAMAGRTTRYSSYISWAGTSEMFSKWGEFAPVTRILTEGGHMMRNQQGWVEAGQGGMTGPPWTALSGYAARSPYLAADRITAPVLLITADKDFVPMSQSELMFSALYRLGGTARLVTYWGEEHSLWSPANIRDVYAQIFDWLERTLADPSPVSPPQTTVAPRPGPTPRTRPQP